MQSVCSIKEGGLDERTKREKAESQLDEEETRKNERKGKKEEEEDEGE